VAAAKRTRQAIVSELMKEQALRALPGRPEPNARLGRGATSTRVPDVLAWAHAPRACAGFPVSSEFVVRISPPQAERSRNPHDRPTLLG